MSEIKNGRLGLYGAEYSKCNRMMTLGFKGLAQRCKLTTLDNAEHGELYYDLVPFTSILFTYLLTYLYLYYRQDVHVDLQLVS